VGGGGGGGGGQGGGGGEGAGGAGGAGKFLWRRPEWGPAADGSRTGLDEVDDLGMSPFLCHGFASSIQLDEQLALQAKRFNLLVAPRSGPRLQMFFGSNS